IAQAYGVSAAEGMSGTGAVSLDVRAQGAIKNPDAMAFSGNGSLNEASITVPALTKPVRVHTANLRFSQNAAVLDNLQFSLGSTNARGQLTLRGLTPAATPQAQFTLNADNFNVT